MANNDPFMASINAFVDSATANMEQVVRVAGISILARLVDMSPVGNPEIWAVNKTAANYNRAVSDANQSAMQDPANLTRTGRLRRRDRVSDSMDITAPPGYTGGRFRGNWQVSFDTVANGETGQIDENGNETKAAGNIVLEQFRVGTRAIYFANNVPYAYRLEFGHSTQAPGGMVRVTAEEFQAFFNAAAQELAK